MLPNQTANVVDTSQIELYPENDLDLFINGTVKLLQSFSKVPGRMYFERYIRGKWHQEVLNRKYPDLCFSLFNPMEPFYETTKDFPRCPFNAGVSDEKLEMLMTVFC